MFRNVIKNLKTLSQSQKTIFSTTKAYNVVGIIRKHISKIDKNSLMNQLLVKLNISNDQKNALYLQGILYN